MNDQTSGNDDLATLTQAAHDWRERLRSPRLSAEERKAFEAWVQADVRHEEAYDRAVTIWAAYDHIGSADIAADLQRASARELWVRFKSSAGSASRTAGARLAAASFFAAIVALLALPLAINIDFGAEPSDITAEPQRATYASSNGETLTITLPDGTEATLGPETTLTTALSSQSRDVEIAGGAVLFDVASDADRPFTVSAGDLTATALGTRFDVRRNGGVARVAVSEGAVRVRYPFWASGRKFSMTTSATLVAGQQIAAADGEGLRSVQPMLTDKVGAWADGALVYDGATLGELIADADRYYAGEIVFMGDADHVAGLTVTASFNGDDIDRLLDLIALSFPVDVDASETDRVVIRPKGER